MAIVWALLSSASALAAITLTESSLRSALVVDTKRPNTDKLTLRATFQLGPGEAADPAKETVVLTVGPFSQTLPPGSFKPRVSANRTTWTFRGPRNGLKYMEITRSSQVWTIDARAKNINLSAMANPITIKIQIGDDTGSRSLFFVMTTLGRWQLFKFPAGKKDDADGDEFTPKEGDCDDQEPTTYPGAPELCDGVANNCNKTVDEGLDLGIACSAGVGVCQWNGVKVCAPDESTTLCKATPGAPGEELCGNALDDDCDGTTDEGFDVGTTCSAGVGACQRSGTKVCSADGKGTVCNATPGSPTAEVCNNVDDNCNGQVDDGAGQPVTCGVVACARTVSSCTNG